MVRKQCPHCHQVYSVMPNTGDYVHMCSSRNLTLDQEDVPVISTTVNENGQDISTGRALGDIPYQGVVNEAQGSLAEIKGVNVEDMTSRGKRVSTHRQRQVYTYIEDESKN